MNIDPVVRHNARQLYADIFWYGVLAGSAIAFLPVYAARLGASGGQIALLTAGPALVNLFGSLPVAHWLANRALIRTTLYLSIWYRLGFAVLLTMPWWLPTTAQVWGLPLLITVMAIPGVALAIGFNAVFADVIPADYRSTVVGRRNALMAASLMSTSLGCGWVLDHLAFPGNYQIVFAIGVVGAALSSYYLSRLRPLAQTPERVGQPFNELARPGLMRFGDAVREAVGLRFLTRAAGQRLLRLDLLQGAFGRLLVAYLLFYIFQNLSASLYPLMWVNELHLSDGIISIGSALFNLVMLLVSLGLPALTARFGQKPVLVFSALAYGIYPLLHAVAQGPELFLLSSAVGGGAWGLAAGVLVTHLMEQVPAHDRPAHMALHNLALNAGLLLGALLGPTLDDALGLRSALLVSALLRAVAAGALWLWG